MMKSTRHIRSSAARVIVLSIALRGASSAAQSQPSATTPADARAAYAIPWIMRPAIAPTLLRIESSIASRRDGVASVTMLTAGYAIAPALFGVYGRIALTHSRLSSGNPIMHGVPTGAVANPLVMALFTPEVARGVRVSVVAASALPLAMGGGDAPSPLAASSLATGVLTRSSMDSALFAANYASVISGLGVALIRAGFTAQLEATAIVLARVRGARSPTATDETRANLTLGASFGFLVHRAVTVSAEAHYQRWLYAPNLLGAAGSSVDQLSFDVGARANVPLSPTVLARPGLAFAVGLGGPMAANEVFIARIDVPVTF
jgi:hypothetical protein